MRIKILSLTCICFSLFHLPLLGWSEDLPLDATSEPHTEENATTPLAENIDLKEVTHAPTNTSLFPQSIDEANPKQNDTLLVKPNDSSRISAVDVDKKLNEVRHLLGVDIPPATTTRINWIPSRSFSGMAVETPVLVANGKWDGPTLCLTAAIHGDELNGIEMVRRVLYDLDPNKLHGMIVGVPIVNLLGFSRNSRYLPDRRDLNRYFPGNPKGSAASRLAFAFFNDVILHCDTLVDLHTGSFYRTNITQLRADMRNEKVVKFVELFGDIPVLNTSGNPRSLRAAAVRANIPTVTVEAGEPMRMQIDVVNEGVNAINTLLEKNGMYPSFSLWAKPSPAFYSSQWSRSNSAGILFSKVKLGAQVKVGDILGEVINPVTNEKKKILAKHEGRVLGMALDQFVLPGFAAYHIGLRKTRAEETLEQESNAETANSNALSQTIQGSEEVQTSQLQTQLSTKTQNDKPEKSDSPQINPALDQTNRNDDISSPETLPLTPEEEGFDD